MSVEKLAVASLARIHGEMLQYVHLKHDPTRATLAEWADEIVTVCDALNQRATPPKEPSP